MAILISVGKKGTNAILYHAEKGAWKGKNRSESSRSLAPNRKYIKKVSFTYELVIFSRIIIDSPSEFSLSR
jgi:hypothetical protein